VNLPVPEVDHKCHFRWACYVVDVTDSYLRVDIVLPIPDSVIWLTYAVISCLRSLARQEQAYLRYGFEHPASTLPTRFPAALGIGHGSACGLANASALVYVAA